LKLWISRHGFAGKPSADPKVERERPLKPEGIAMVKAIGQAMLDAGEQPKIVFCSPYTRTTMSADILGGMLGISVNVVGDMAPQRPLTPALQSLIGVTGSEQMKRVLLVGHVDNTSPCMTDLGTNDDWNDLVMAECRRVKIDRDTLEWSLKWGVKPSDLGLRDVTG
jgi:phosphohistidine phosphatase SixA